VIVQLIAGTAGVRGPQQMFFYLLGCSTRPPWAPQAELVFPARWIAFFRMKLSNFARVRY